MATSRISPYNLNDLKSTTDDALGNYLRSLNYVQDNTKMDVKLALGFSAVAVAAATFYFDRKLGWEATKDWTAVAVVAYALLNAAFTWWIWGVEKKIVFEGTPPTGQKTSFASKTNKHDPTYYLTVTRGQSKPMEIQEPFTTWFTEDGRFVAEPFQNWLSSAGLKKTQ
ncbi:hypothetical protein K470DRAFT_219733 [Piedraia hortae CBS 480.64]|uniref:Signal peptidase complex subunit 2 n=1 Tax=Piedraia hortae CBS 480.64 TaxID=1314780 RepID=A0A6A7BVG5_9PEZI|nr:hypothetical protein K470DRAFT_219733 [Piedraia hortae CBS 480.64]